MTAVDEWTVETTGAGQVAVDPRCRAASHPGCGGRCRMFVTTQAATEYAQAMSGQVDG